MWLVSPTEPKEFDVLGRRSSLPEQFGVDFLGVGLVGVQRKTINDFLASMVDGRLEKELAQMKRLRVAALVIEGEWRWTTDGHLVESPGWSLDAVTAALWSIQLVHGVIWWQSRWPDETVRLLEKFEVWVGKGKHAGFLRRPKPYVPPWGRGDNREWALHLLQSFPGIGPERAAAIYDTLGIPLRWTVTEKELARVPGIGAKTARRLVEALELGQARSRSA